MWRRATPCVTQRTAAARARRQRDTLVGVTMWCCVFVLVCTVLDVGWGSIVEITDIQFSSLPPLYDLDEWSLCQRPGDVYCTVDAALLARSPSPTLTLLQEYSKQTLKHFNRTQIHRGVCVTRCGSHNHTDGWHPAARRCVNQGLVKYGLEAEVLSVEWCMPVDEPPEASGAARALAVLSTVLVALTCLATGVHFLGDRCAKAECNKYLLAFSLKRNWAILTYDRSKPRTNDKMKDVRCIEGIRVVGTQCVIFSHVLLIYVYSYIDNPQFIEKMYDQFGWQVLLNSPLWLQAFFAMSGFLTAYAVLLSAPTNPITFWKCVMSIVNRWIRLTPAALFALWATMAWLPLLGAGPAWGRLAAREAADCRPRWWYHALYLHNHLPTGKFCMGHTWYLAADMQMHVVGVFVLLLLVRCRRARVPVLLALLAGSALAAGLVTYFNHLTPIVTAQTPEILRTMFLGSRILTQLFLPSWMNLPGYVSGVAVAFLLAHNNNNGNIKLHENKWFGALFHSSLALGGCVVAVGAVFLADAPLPRWAAALYAALDRTLIAVFFGIFMLGCFSGCKSALRGWLEWRGFHALGRLSYCAFLVHFLVLRLALATHTHMGHATILALVSLLISTSVLCYFVAVPLCLLVELPLLQLWRALAEPEPAERPAERPAAAPRPPLKPLDLLDQLRRRQEP